MSCTLGAPTCPRRSSRSACRCAGGARGRLGAPSSGRAQSLRPGHDWRASRGAWGAGSVGRVRAGRSGPLRAPGPASSRQRVLLLPIRRFGDVASLLHALAGLGAGLGSAFASRGRTRALPLPPMPFSVEGVCDMGLGAGLDPTRSPTSCVTARDPCGPVKRPTPQCLAVAVAEMCSPLVSQPGGGGGALAPRSGSQRRPAVRQPSCGPGG